MPLRFFKNRSLCILARLDAIPEGWHFAVNPHEDTPPHCCLSWALDEPQSSLEAGLVAAKIWGAAVGMMRAGTLRSKHGLLRYDFGRNERHQRVVWFAKVPAGFFENRLGHSPRDQICGDTQPPANVSALIKSRPAMPQLAAASSGARADVDSPEDDVDGGVSDDDDDEQKNDDGGRGGRAKKQGRFVTRPADVRIDTTDLTGHCDTPELFAAYALIKRLLHADGTGLCTIPGDVTRGVSNFLASYSRVY